MTTVAKNAGENGVFGTLLQDIGSGIGSTVKEVLPIWASQQLHLQSTDQLNRNTYAGDHSQNLSALPSSTENAQPQSSFFNEYKIPLFIAGGLFVTAAAYAAFK